MGLEITLAGAMAAFSAAATAVGVGISYSAQMDAARTASQIALVNAQSQTQAAQQQGKVASMQALINKTLSDKDKAAALANADMLRKTAEMGTRTSTENVRRSREEMARMLSLQRAQAIKSGFVDTTGSPLALLADTAEEEQRAADSIRYEDEMSRRSLFREATFQVNQGRAATISGLSAKAGGMAARTQAAMMGSQAKLDLFSARAGASAARTQAGAGLISSAGGLSQNIYTNYQSGAWKRTPRGVPGGVSATK